MGEQIENPADGENLESANPKHTSQQINALYGFNILFWVVAYGILNLIGYLTTLIANRCFGKDLKFNPLFAFQVVIPGISTCILLWIYDFMISKQITLPIRMFLVILLINIFYQFVIWFGTTYLPIPCPKFVNGTV